MSSRNTLLRSDSVPYTGRRVGHTASFLRGGFDLTLNLTSGNFRRHNLSSTEAREISAAVTLRNQEREGKRDPKNCMAGWTPVVEGEKLTAAV